MEQDHGEAKKRVAFVLIDGLGDVSIPKLGYKTPLQVANIPNLDAIASAGINGLMDPVEVGLGCGSDTAHLSIMGYDPRVYYRGRGAFESMGAGLAMSPGDIAFKVCAFLSSCFVFILLSFVGFDIVRIVFFLSCSLILQLWMRNLELLLVGELIDISKKKVLYFVQLLME